MIIERTAHEWSKEALFAKAQRYTEKMIEKDPSDWEFGFWSALALEMLVRTSIANISPALVADGKDWNSILYAVGKTPNQSKFTPKSAAISELLNRVESIHTNFTREMLNFSISHMNSRNSDIHSGALPFDDVRSSSWLPMFYSVCEVLVESFGETLENLFGKDMAKEAKLQITALLDDNAKSVKGTINAHQTIWNEKDSAEKSSLAKKAELLATKQQGHRVKCPACNSDALLQGSSSGAPQTSVKEDGIFEKQSMLPTSFECTACGLKISGLSKLVACGLGDTYTSTNHYDAVEYFQIDIEGEFEARMYEDNNEPW